MAGCVLLLMGVGVVERAPAQTEDHGSGCSPATSAPASFEAVRLYVEYNATDNDLGVHGAVDAEAYSELCIYRPDGTLILAIKPHGPLQALMLSGIFFESREPLTSEFAFGDLARIFPEGEYNVIGATTTGQSLTGFATFTHHIPEAPRVISPPLARDEEHADEAAVPAGHLQIAWEEVTRTVQGDPVKITGYEVTVTDVEREDPNGFSQPTFDVHLPADRHSLSVSPEFLEPHTLYELEVLALEESGNQTITSGFFVTE
jgi:hypothetical protein